MVVKASMKHERGPKSKEALAVFQIPALTDADPTPGLACLL